MIDIGIRELLTHGESVDELLQRRCGAQVRLPGRHHEDQASESARARFDQALHLSSAPGVLIDESLHLIQHNQRGGELAVGVADGGEYLFDEVEELRKRDGFRGRKLDLQQLSGFVCAGCPSGLGRQDALRQLGDVQVRQDEIPVTAPLEDELDHRVVDALLPHPQHAAGSRDIGREPGGT